MYILKRIFSTCSQQTCTNNFIAAPFPVGKTNTHCSSLHDLGFLPRGLLLDSIYWASTTPTPTRATAPSPGTQPRGPPAGKDVAAPKPRPLSPQKAPPTSVAGRGQRRGGGGRAWPECAVEAGGGSSFQHRSRNCPKTEKGILLIIFLCQ